MREKQNQVKSIKRRIDETHSFAQTPATWNSRRHFWLGVLDAKREDSVINNEEYAQLYDHLQELSRS